jgi:hypothetical protein
MGKCGNQRKQKNEEKLSENGEKLQKNVSLKKEFPL